MAYKVNSFFPVSEDLYQKIDTSKMMNYTFIDTTFDQIAPLL